MALYEYTSVLGLLAILHDRVIMDTFFFHGKRVVIGN